MNSLQYIGMMLAALVLAASAHAAGDARRFTGYKLEMPRETQPYTAEEGDKVVAETPSHALIHQTGYIGAACATGEYVLIHKNARPGKRSIAAPAMTAALSPS